MNPPSGYRSYFNKYIQSLGINSQWLTADSNGNLKGQNLLGTAGQVTLSGTPGTGATTISLPSTVSINDLKLLNLTANKPVKTDANKQLTSALIDILSDTTGTLPVNRGGTNSTTALANNMLMASNAGAIVELTSSTNPVFAGAQLTGLTASRPLKTDGTKTLVSSLIDLTTDVTGTLPVGRGGTGSGTALTNGKLMVSAGGVIAEGTDSSAPTFSGATFSGLTGSRPVKTTVGKALTSGFIDLTADVTGVLPVANGGSTGGNTGDVTLAAVGSAPNANGASLAGQVLTLQPASATQPGVVVTGNQTFGPGDKGFTGNINISKSIPTLALINTVGGTSQIQLAGSSPVSADRSTIYYDGASHNLTISNDSPLNGVIAFYTNAGTGLMILSSTVTTFQQLISVSTNGAKFNNATASYTPSVLDYYETGSFVVSMSGAYTAAQNVTITFCRVGKSVNIEWSSGVAACTNTTTIQSAAGAFPARLRPTGQPALFYDGRSGGLPCFAKVLLTLGGQLQVSNASAGTGFFDGSTGAAGGFLWGSMSYVTP